MWCVLSSHKLFMHEGVLDRNISIHGLSLNPRVYNPWPWPWPWGQALVHATRQDSHECWNTSLLPVIFHLNKSKFIFVWTNSFHRAVFWLRWLLSKQKVRRLTLIWILSGPIESSARRSIKIDWLRRMNIFVRIQKTRCGLMKGREEWKFKRNR